MVMAVRSYQDKYTYKDKDKYKFNEKDKDKEKFNENRYAFKRIKHSPKGQVAGSNPAGVAIIPK